MNVQAEFKLRLSKWTNNRYRVRAQLRNLLTNSITEWKLQTSF